MSRFQVGPPDVKWFNSDGTPTPYGYERLKQIMERIPTQAVSGTLEPTAAQSLKYNTTTKQYEPG